MLENALEFTGTDADVGETGKIEARNQAMDFIHEIGWLLHRSQVKHRLVHLDPNTDLFPLRRFKWLMEFSMGHEWCAVVKKLLNIFFDGTVAAGEHQTVQLALSDMCLLHRAVRKNCKSLVELLLRYVPENALEDLESKQKELVDAGHQSLLFKPDAIGPAGLTPLHIAAGKDGSEDVLDALTEDPGMVIRLIFHEFSLQHRLKFTFLCLTVLLNLETVPVHAYFQSLFSVWNSYQVASLIFSIGNQQ